MATEDRPYKQTMSHDVFGHMTGLEKKHWAVAGLPTSETYANNRNTAWSYDADGRLLQSGEPTITYAYDAAGRMIHTNSDSRVDITQSFDGDGQILKRYEVDTIYEEGQPPHTESSTLYQLRSSVLSGQVLTELGAQGEKARTYVYANGSLLAWQQLVYVNGVVTAQLPVWEHRDASNISYRTSRLDGLSDLEDAAELDPFGSNAGLENPYHFPPDPPLPHKPNVFYPGFSSGSDVACRVDTVDLPCIEAMRMVNAHAATVDLPPKRNRNRVEFIGDYVIVDHYTNLDGNAFYQHTRFVGVNVPNTVDRKVNNAFGDASTAISRKRGKKKDPCTSFFTQGRTLEEVSAIFASFWKSAFHDPKLPATASTANSGQGMAASVRLGNAFFADDDTTPGTGLSWSFANNIYLTNAHQLSARQNRALTILHEFAHALGLIPSDNPRVDPSGKQSTANDATIYKNCGHILNLLPLRD